MMAAIFKYVPLVVEYDAKNTFDARNEIFMPQNPTSDVSHINFGYIFAFLG